MLINEIFTSIDGESKRAGELATFIRTVGCNLRCSYCDSKYTWEKEETSKEMDPVEILEYCQYEDINNITFTGGEPLIQKDADDLITLLANNEFDVCIETDGAVDFTNREWFKKNNPNVWVCADYKCLESGMTDRMLPIKYFEKLRSQDVLKFVVGSQESLELAKSVMMKLRERGCDCYFYISPVFGAIEPKEIVEFIKHNKMQYKVRFQLQLHKFVWDPQLRGV